MESKAPTLAIDSTNPKCGTQGCGICPSLPMIDAEISKAQEALAELSKRRETLQIQRQSNYHHKSPINRLPVEMISEIFLNTLSHNNDYPYQQLTRGKPLLLASVCQTWRNLAFATPQLWSYIKISVKADGPAYSTDLAQKWLSRSCSLPLSMKMEFQDCLKLCDLNNTSDKPSLIEIIRSHSTRWRSIDIESDCPFLLHSLFNGLQDPPADLQFLTVGWCPTEPLTFHAGNVLFPRAIYQRNPRTDGSVGLWDLPCGYERLTHIHLDCVPVDEALYFLKHASNLIECNVTLNTEEDEPDYTFPLPASPIVSQHLTCLHVSLTGDHDFFRHLTFPSLSFLDVEYWRMSEVADVEELASCISRPSLPPPDFTLNVNLLKDANGWWENLPSITSLRLCHSEIEDNLYPASPQRCVSTEEFLAALARQSDRPVVLPKLKKLSLVVPGMSEASWDSLCEIVQDRVNRAPLESISLSITCSWKRDFHLEHRFFHRFVALKKYGVQLKVEFDERGPRFGSLNYT